MLNIAALLLLLVQIGNVPGTPQQQRVEKASIEGVVLRSGSGEPLGRAQVKLLRVVADDSTFDGAGDPETNGLPSVLTESDGKFLLKDLDPGQYRITVVRNGYAEQSYGQKSANSPGRIINLISGEVVKNVVFRLITAGTVRGRVRDTAGEPVEGLTVALLRIEYGSGGRKKLWTENIAQTDDRGEYRLYWVKSGRYYVRVTSRSDYTSRNAITDPNFVTTYYPSSPDPSNASVIELQAGSELAGIDIILSKPSGHWIRGRVMDSSGKPPKVVSVSVHPRQAATVVDVESVFGERGGAVYNPTNGTFEIRNVNPGSYWLSASTSRDYDAPISTDRLSEVRTGQDLFNVMFSADGAVQIPIEMPTSDLNDVVLTLAKGNTIPVIVSVEGSDLSSVKDMDKVRVTLMPAVESYVDYSSTRFNVQGAARIENVLPGEYRARVGQPKSTTLYAKAMRYGQNDALRDSFQITDLPPGTLTVVLSDQGGRIEGNLTDDLAQPVSGVQVVLIPDVIEKGSSFRTANTNRDGHFVFTILPPGGYKLYSWEDLESKAYYDNEVLSKYEAQGKPAQVQESSKVNVDLKIIPAARQ
jgi:protocatechuate 3,4-dioxygenase beta subunit